ncbi:DUF2490 domain-containing protein [Hymenobacter rubripertinctus]|uniref:DUF2490 domain-containing protein n=1 Tax=Hymenobacter rubripertinctus TaxID=2029981 RepID=A0A418R4I9_9BACT|nr:DUF2490 domain-containing protein [Hymenobacter rubripertinctus]RIY12378.1 DUF2490 domain-containing protein [Hymenobacter rubripertinctus]
MTTHFFARQISGLVRALLVVGLLAARLAPAQAQSLHIKDPQWGSWLITTAVLPGGPRGWGGYAEVQTRTNGVLRQFFYTELKAGVSYGVAKNFNLLLGGGRYSTANYRDLKAGALNVERRLWQQLVLTQFTARLKLEHRYRIEQRWFRFRDDVVPAGAFVYRNRLRYRFNAFLPLNHQTFTDKTVFLSAYNEVFFNPRGPFFERNRLYAGAGYQFDQHWTAQAGWVNQANYTAARNGPAGFVPQTNVAKNNLVLSVLYRISRPDKPARQHVPSQQD